MEEDTKEMEVDKIDADSIVDVFLDENPDLIDVPVEEWPPEAIEMLKETFNEEYVDEPNGALPEGEEQSGEATLEQQAETGDDDASEDLEQEEESDAPPDEAPEGDAEDFEILELAKLVEAGDKDEAWNMLQNMFGIQAPASRTNALDRMNERSESGSGNALARLMSELRF